MVPEELVKAMDDYERAFSDNFPADPLVVSRPPEEVISIIRDCLDKKKDVYELGYLSLDENIMY